MEKTIAICCFCNGKIELNIKAIEEETGKLIRCKHCKRYTDMFYCKKCLTLHTVDDIQAINASNDIHCKECLTYKACTYCGRTWKEGQYYNYLGKIICYKCFGQYYRRCDTCNGLFFLDQLKSGYKDSIVCINCKATLSVENNEVNVSEDDILNFVSKFNTDKPPEFVKIKPAKLTITPQTKDKKINKYAVEWNIDDDFLDEVMNLISSSFVDFSSTYRIKVFGITTQSSTYPSDAHIVIRTSEKIIKQMKDVDSILKLFPNVYLYDQPLRKFDIGVGITYAIREAIHMTKDQISLSRLKYLFDYLLNLSSEDISASEKQKSKLQPNNTKHPINISEPIKKLLRGKTKASNEHGYTYILNNKVTTTTTATYKPVSSQYDTDLYKLYETAFEKDNEYK